MRGAVIFFLNSSYNFWNQVNNSSVSRAYIQDFWKKILIVMGIEMSIKTHQRKVKWSRGKAEKMGVSI